MADDPTAGTAYASVLGATPGAPYNRATAPPAPASIGPPVASMLAHLNDIKNPPFQPDPVGAANDPDPLIATLRAANALAARNNPEDAQHLASMLALIERLDAERRAQASGVASQVEAQRRQDYNTNAAQSREMTDTLRDQLQRLQKLQKAYGLAPGGSASKGGSDGR
jgi:hypothetical protein